MRTYDDRDVRLRSRVEHLHENVYLEPFDRDVRLDLVKKEAIIEYIARTALVRIISNEALWPHFVNTVALKKPFGHYRATSAGNTGATPLTRWCRSQNSTRNICTTGISERPISLPTSGVDRG